MLTANLILLLLRCSLLFLLLPLLGSESAIAQAPVQCSGFASPPAYFETFLDAELGLEWIRPIDGRVITSAGCGDQGFVQFDSPSQGLYVLNELILCVQANGPAPILRFGTRNQGDERHVLPPTFSGSRNGDGVSVSTDGGTTWNLLLDMPVGPADSTCSEVVAPLGAYLGQAILIKFQQFDNATAPTDGFTLEYVAIENACLADVDCDDGLFCNGPELCNPATGCQSGTAPCNDDIACTDDQCDEALSECIYLPNNAMCADGIFCNGIETCDPLRGCEPGSKPCPPSFICNEGGDTCFPCTTDAQCSDGVFCNGIETCDPVQGCQPGSNPCSSGPTCNEEEDACWPCTSDVLCNDGVFCNGSEVCHNGVCVFGTPPTCSDGVACTVDSCNFTTDSCENIPSHAACANGLHCDGAEICDPALGCVPGDPIVCDDGIECTEDQCDDELDKCVFIPDDTKCDDGLFCNGPETCDGECIPGEPPCLPISICHEDTDTCEVLQCINDEDCPAGPFCQGIPRCESTMCVYTPPLCDDSLFCNGQEACHPSSGCIQVSMSCPATCVCNEQMDRCLCGCPGQPCPQPPPCQAVQCIGSSCVYSPVSEGTPCQSDSIACTADVCDGFGACIHLPDNSLCADQTVCNGNETCNPDLGGCTSGEPLSCSDASTCTTDSCHPVTGCTFTPIDCPPIACHTALCDAVLGCQYESFCDSFPGLCNDGNVCTQEICDENVPDCCTYVQVPCQDLPCQRNTGCDPVAGCLYLDDCRVMSASSAAGFSCCSDDGNPCTLEFCDFGLCRIAPDCVTAAECDDGSVCSVNTCVNSCCESTPVVCPAQPCFTSQGCDPILGCQYAPLIPCCGNGELESNETCDPPGTLLPNGDVCRSDCAYCGDGITNGDESCDDGNNDPDDGCAGCSLLGFTQNRWRGPVGGLWSNPMFWSGEHIPTEAELILIESGGVVNLDISTAARSLTLEANARISVVREVAVTTRDIRNDGTIEAVGGDLFLRSCQIGGLGTMTAQTNTSIRLSAKSNNCSILTITDNLLRTTGDSRIEFPSLTSLENVAIETDGLGAIELLDSHALTWTDAISNQSSLAAIGPSDLIFDAGGSSLVSFLVINGVGRIAAETPLGDLTVAGAPAVAHLQSFEAVHGGSLRLETDISGTSDFAAQGGVLEVNGSLGARAIIGANLLAEEDELGNPGVANILGHVTLDMTKIYARPGGIIEARSENDSGSSPVLRSSNVTVFGRGNPRGGQFHLRDASSLRVLGDFVLDGQSVTSCGDGGRALGGQTPPIKGLKGHALLVVNGNIDYLGGVAADCSSTQAVVLGGSFNNFSTLPDCFNYINGKMRITGHTEHAVEVAGEDRGDFPDACRDNFALGGLEIDVGAHVLFRDVFDNQPVSESTGDIDYDGMALVSDWMHFENCYDGPGLSGITSRCRSSFDWDTDSDIDLHDVQRFQSQFCASEALYVRELILRPESALTVDNCVLYYGTLVDEGGTISTIGCGRHRQLRLPLIVATDPPDGAIDARRPSDESQGGWRSIGFTFGKSLTSVTRADFVLASDRGLAPKPGAPVTEENQVRLSLDRGLPRGSWTRITYGCNQSVCIGSLPGDVNGDGTTGPADLLYLVDYFGVGTSHLAIWQCDIDRSGACTIADILAEIDLLSTWNGHTIGLCP